jgi:EpsI family protein
VRHAGVGYNERRNFCLFDFVKSKAVLAATLILLVQAAVLYSSVRPEAVPEGRPLSSLPLMLGSWDLVGEPVVDDETRDILKADDLMYRQYRDSSTGRSGTLFVAAFRSQRNGKTPHSPKNCLPGSGWTQLSSGDYSIDVGGGQPIVVNRYVVQHGDDRSVVLYWYQSRDRVVASEYKAKFWVMADAIRLNRTDTALVRVVMPVINGDADAATRVGASFVQSFFGTLRQFLPS